MVTDAPHPQAAAIRPEPNPFVGLSDDLGTLALAGYPDNPLRSARLCIVALADELGIDPARALELSVDRVKGQLARLDRSANGGETPALAWQRTARQETLRSLFEAFR